MHSKLKQCRICSSNKLELALRLKPMPLGDKYAKKKNKYNEFLEINLLNCKNCRHLQTSTIPNRKRIYTNYLSRPAAINANLSKEYLQYANDLKKYVKRDELIIDIGSNDGGFLKFFKKNKYKKLIGVEPAKNLAKYANKIGIKTINDFFGEKIVQKINLNFKAKAKIILNNHSLSNVSNINEILFNVKSCLHQKGVYSIQTFYTTDVMKKKLLENFNHEHLNYFYVSTLNTMAKRHGLEVFKAFHVPAKGGSIRVYIGHIGSYKIDKSVKHFENLEKKTINSLSIHQNVERFIKQNKLKIKNIIKKTKSKNIIGYGTSIGATTFITQYDLSKKIKFLIDDDIFRQKRFSPGFNIPTVSNSIIKKTNPDLIIILAPLYFSNIAKKINKSFGKYNILKIWPKIELKKK